MISVSEVSWVSPLGSLKALVVDNYMLSKAVVVEQHGNWVWQTSVGVSVGHTLATRGCVNTTLEA
jgi:hypothetical protein